MPASVPALTAIACGTDGDPGGGSSTSASDDADGGIGMPDRVEDLVDAGGPAGPRLGEEAKGVCDAPSAEAAGR
ncbi:hypothetical protein [Streptomyces sp. NPDC090994]|uniref:hypothetical protein n=1 Tax=Streptomyces sp. NPDC090994 TaxID=3365969 RepID=UPI0037FAFAC8